MRQGGGVVLLVGCHVIACLRCSQQLERGRCVTGGVCENVVERQGPYKRSWCSSFQITNGYPQSWQGSQVPRVLRWVRSPQRLYRIVTLVHSAGGCVKG